MTRRMVIMLAIVGAILASFVAFQMVKAKFIKSFVAAMGNQAATVSAMTASTQSWSPTLKAVGSLRAIQGTDIAPQLAGIVADVPFKSGEEVKAGDVLLQLVDDDDVATLNSLKASAELARLTYERNKELVLTHAVSQASLDNAIANYRSAQAQVAAQQALVEKKRIKAPFAGRVGIRLVDVGQYLSAGTKVTTLQSLDPIYIDFFLPQQAVRLVKPGQKVTAATDAFPGESFTGEIVAIDSKLDAETRNVSVRAELSNPAHRLLPGMFGSVTIVTGAPASILTLPRTAITYNPYGQSIFIVSKGEPDEDGKPVLTVRQTFVTTGEARGDQIEILEGAKEGDMVVTAGQIKLRNGSHVVIDNNVKMPNDPAPTVQDK